MSRVIRHPYMIGVREQAKFKDTYGGEPGWVFIEGMQIRPSNGADSACTPSHTQRLYEAIPHVDKEIREVKGASLYYMGQRDELAQCIEI
jgi:hypothetical protein